MKETLDWQFKNFKPTCPHYSNHGVIKHSMPTEFVKTTSYKSHIPDAHADEIALSSDMYDDLMKRV